MDGDRARLNFALFGVALFCAALAGCGGESDGDGASGSSLPLCSMAACGGDLLGPWNYESTCVDAPALQLDPNCPAATIQVTSITGNATYDFQSSGMAVSTFSFTENDRVVLPHSCSTDTCAELEQRLTDSLASVVNTLVQQGIEASSGVTCHDDGSSCACSTTLSRSGTSSTPYSTSGTTLTVTDVMSGAEQSFEYCVDGDSVSLRSDLLQSGSVWVRP